MTTTRTTEILLATLRRAKAEFPQMRIAQIIVNAAHGDPFYCEDDTLNSMVLQWLSDQHKAQERMP